MSEEVEGDGSEIRAVNELDMSQEGPDVGRSIG